MDIQQIVLSQRKLWLAAGIDTSHLKDCGRPYFSEKKNSKQGRYKAVPTGGSYLRKNEQINIVRTEQKCS